jgi:hypothetical protein
MHRGFDRPTDDGTYTPTRMNINYGNNHPAPSKYRHLAHTWRPVVFGNDLDDWNWMWSKERPVHFICHSQGGNTVRYRAGTRICFLAQIFQPEIAKPGSSQLLQSVRLTKGRL